MAPVPPGLKAVQSTALAFREGEQEQRKDTVSPSGGSHEPSRKGEMNQGHDRAADVSAGDREPRAQPGTGTAGTRGTGSCGSLRLGPHIFLGVVGMSPRSFPQQKARAELSASGPPSPASVGPAAALLGAGGGLWLEGMRESPEDTEGPPCIHRSQPAAAVGSVSPGILTSPSGAQTES